MLTLEQHDSVALIRLQHGKANALDLELTEALNGALEEARHAAALVLAGAGPIFSAGVDLRRLAQSEAGYVEAFLPALERFFGALFRFPAPTVAAVGGHAIAGGAVLACACDRRLVAEGPWKMAVPELLVGVPFPPTALEIVRAAVGAPFLDELVLAGRTLSGDELRASGLAHERVEPDRLEARALEEARRLATIPGRSYELNKRQLRQGADDLLEAHGEAWLRESIDAWNDPVAREALDAYVARTLAATS